MLLKTQENSDFSSLFYQLLPNRPYCTDDLDKGLFIRIKKIAIKQPYIQVNPPFQIYFIVFDIDRADGFFAWQDANVAPPNWISKNPQNGHTHIGYILKTPVTRTYRGRQKVIRYLARIEQAYVKALGADKGYVGLITKNPCNSTWENHIYSDQPYELDYLADFVDLEPLPKTPSEVSGYGRNCMLFDTVRFWAYRAIREYSDQWYEVWYQHVLDEAMSVNLRFPQPLAHSEVKATAKSIARWVWLHNEDSYSYFVERQAEKGRKGGLASNSSNGGKARSAQYTDLRQEALKLHLQGKKITEIAKILNTHRNSVSKWIKQPTALA